MMDFILMNVLLPLAAIVMLCMFVLFIYSVWSEHKEMKKELEERYNNDMFSE